MLTINIQYQTITSKNFDSYHMKCLETYGLVVIHITNTKLHLQTITLAWQISLDNVLWASMLQIDSQWIFRGTLNRECRVRPRWRRFAAMPVDPTAKAMLPPFIVLTAANIPFKTNVFPEGLNDFHEIFFLALGL